MENVATEEFISRTEALKDFEGKNARNPNWTPQRVKTLLLRQPAADVVEVVHANWIPFHSKAAGDIQYCSACDIGFDARMDYCPHCGASMDGWMEDADNGE